MKKVLQCVWREKLNILISACLLGDRVRYDGKCKSYDISKLENYNLVSCCPEVDGGLPTPRFPSEIMSDGRVVNSENIDVSEEFNIGAKNALNIAKFFQNLVTVWPESSLENFLYAIYRTIDRAFIMPNHVRMMACSI